MFAYRIGLRLMLLLSLAACLLLAWLGIKKDLYKMEAELSGTNSNWEKFGEASSIHFGDNGELLGAYIHSGADMGQLLAKYECSTLEELVINSQEAYRKFPPKRFPSLKRLNLARIDLTAEQLAKVSKLTNLERLTVNQDLRDDDLNSAWVGLASNSNLKQLVLHVRPDVSFSEFPELKSLRTLTLRSPQATDEQESELQRRLPHCTIIR